MAPVGASTARMICVTPSSPRVHVGRQRYVMASEVPLYLSSNATPTALRHHDFLTTEELYSEAFAAADASGTSYTAIADDMAGFLSSVSKALREPNTC